MPVIFGSESNSKLKVFVADGAAMRGACRLHSFLFDYQGNLKLILEKSRNFFFKFLWGLC